MKTKNEYVQEIAGLILQCKKVIENEWEQLVFVFDTADGHVANSGFLYNRGKVRPVSAGIESSPLLLSDTIIELRQAVAVECGDKFKQFLIQMDKESGRFKIDFEFDDANRWTIVPSKMKEMREALRPKF
ncbi:hypothetical protein [Agaribacterium sp. ZY112]|uniref:hypothetical protein n=1 Tax=Agaribacterium sp. ZY112 TaxID=3233574 RepID=UPI003526920E